MRKILLALSLLALTTSAFAQSPVVTQPKQVVTTSNASSTIEVTNTFQSIWSADVQPTLRTGCTVQNNSASNSMWVFFGPVANATKAKSVVLSSGGMSVNCATKTGTVLTDQVSITGTSGDAFFAAKQ